MKITHNNKEYILDPEKAIELGVLNLKPKYVPRAGDVFSSGGCEIVIVQDYHTKNFNCIGIYGFEPYSNAPLNPNSDIIKTMNNWGYEYVGNMSETFKIALKEFVRVNNP